VSLTSKEIYNRLKGRNAAVLEALYEAALRQHAFEIGRQARLDGKATALAAAAGISATLCASMLNSTSPARLGLAFVVPWAIASVVKATDALAVATTDSKVDENQLFDVALLDASDGDR
jgi:hypothetical protein